MRFLPLLLCAACVTTPEPEPAPPLLVIQEPVPTVLTPPCTGPGFAQLELLTPANERIEAGGSTEFIWKVMGVCAPIQLVGVIIQTKSGNEEIADPRPGPPMVLQPEEWTMFTLRFGTRPEKAGSTVEVDITPIWTEVASGKTFVWAQRPEPTAVSVMVIDRSPGTAL